MSQQLPNWWEALVVHLAAIRIGAVSNPLMPILQELRFALASAGSAMPVAATQFRGVDHGSPAVRLAAELPALDHVVVVRGESPGTPPA